MTDGPAPSCPSWCENHKDDAGWDVHTAGVTKTCTLSVTTDDLDGGTVTLILERFASVDEDGLEVDEPVVRVECVGRLDRGRVLALTEALIHLVGLTTGSLPAAA